MNTEIKWADVAHMYQFSDIEIRIGVGDRKFKGVTQLSDARGRIKRALYEDSAGHFVRTTQHEISEYKPILRHREDVTEAESREFMKDFTLFAWEEATQLPVGWKSAKEWAIDILNDGEFTPAQTLWLLNRGFDLFGLIESGQAIRKS